MMRMKLFDVSYICLMLLVLSDVNESSILREIVKTFSSTFEMTIVNVGDTENIRLKDVVDAYSVPWFFIRQHHVFFRIKNLKKAFTFIRESKGNSILISGYRAQFTFIVLGKMLGKHVTFIRHYTDTHHHVMKAHWWLLDIYMNFLSDRVIAVSSMTKSVMTSREFIKPQKVSVIYNAVDIKELLRVRENRQVFKQLYDEPIRIVSIARHVKIKGLDYVLEALRQLEATGFKFKYTLIGAKTRYSRKLEKQIAHFQPGHIEVITDFINVEEILHSNHVLVHVPISRTAESFGLVFIEGLVAGIQCIFTESGILCDLNITEGEPYWKVGYKNASLIAQSLQEIYGGLRKSSSLKTETCSDFSFDTLRLQYMNFMNSNKLN